MKKFFCLLISAFLLISSLSAFSYAADAEFDGKTVVVYTANVRGDISVYAKAAALKKNYSEKCSDVILADAGNFLQGTVYASYDSGKSVVDLMSAAGYDVAAIGSHEFDFGTGKVGVEQHEILYSDESLGKLLSDASFKAVSANILTSDGSLNAFSPTATVTTASGRELGFFGLTAKDTVARVLESNLSGLEFASPEEAAADSVSKLSGCALVIGLSNAGIKTVDGAVILDVLSDSQMTLGVLIIDNASGSVISNTAIDTSTLRLDSEVNAKCSEIKTAVDAEYPKSAIASSIVTLDGLQKDVRGGETNTGDLWCDALRWFATEGNIGAYYDEDDIANGNTGISVPDDHVVALWNGGNLRDFLNSGDVTIKDIKRVLPYPNKVAVMYLTGAELLETLEAGTQGLPYSDASDAACASFPQVSGIKYSIAEYLPYDSGEAYGDHWFKAASVSRVTIESVNGQPFSETDVYAVVTSNAVYNGMDAYYTAAYKDAESSAITSAGVSDVVWMYVAQKLGGVIGSEYASSGDRITVIASGEASSESPSETIMPDAAASSGDSPLESASNVEASQTIASPQTSDSLIAVSAALAVLSGAYLIIKRKFTNA